MSIVYNDNLTEHAISASTGTVGDSYDNALAENFNGSYTKVWATAWRLNVKPNFGNIAPVAK